MTKTIGAYGRPRNRILTRLYETSWAGLEAAGERLAPGGESTRPSSSVVAIPYTIRTVGRIIPRVPPKDLPPRRLVSLVCGTRKGSGAQVFLEERIK
jgi:hypothetical protein